MCDHLLADFLENLIQTLIFLGTDFFVGHCTTVLKQALSLCITNLTLLISNIRLISNHGNRNIVWSFIFEIGKPNFGKIVKTLPLSNIIDQNTSISISKVHSSC